MSATAMEVENAIVSQGRRIDRGTARDVADVTADRGMMLLNDRQRFYCPLPENSARHNEAPPAVLTMKRSRLWRVRPMPATSPQRRLRHSAGADRG
jgi:hypothetical protein